MLRGTNDRKVKGYLEYSEKTKKECLKRSYGRDVKEGESLEVFFSVQNEINEVLIKMGDKHKHIKHEAINDLFMAMHTIIAGVSIAFIRSDLLDQMFMTFDKFMDAELAEREMDEDEDETYMN